MQGVPMRVVGSGLNIRDCKLWTIASVGKLVQLLNEKKDVLWVKWVHRVNMEHTVDFWMQTPSGGLQLVQENLAQT